MFPKFTLCYQQGKPFLWYVGNFFAVLALFITSLVGVLSLGLVIWELDQEVAKYLKNKEKK